MKFLVEVYVMKVGVEWRENCMEPLQTLCSLYYPLSLSFFATLLLFENWRRERHIDQEQQGTNNNNNNETNCFDFLSKKVWRFFFEKNVCSIHPTIISNSNFIWIFPLKLNRCKICSLCNNEFVCSVNSTSWL